MLASPLGSVPWLSLLLFLAACAAGPSEATSAPRSTPEPTVASPAAAGGTALPAPVGKPSAPVVVSMTTRRLAGGDHEVTLTARPTRDLPSLELTLDGQRQQLGPVRAGEEHTLTVRVVVADGAGRDVAAGVATGAGNDRRSHAAMTRVGAPAAAAPPLPVRIRTLSDGTELSEVRP